jgi:hypothetical protein
MSWLKYAVRKKAYYVDGHEKPGTIEYRKHHDILPMSAGLIAGYRLMQRKALQ